MKCKSPIYEERAKPGERKGLCRCKGTRIVNSGTGRRLTTPPPASRCAVKPAGLQHPRPRSVLRLRSGVSWLSGFYQTESTRREMSEVTGRHAGAEAAEPLDRQTIPQRCPMRSVGAQRTRTTTPCVCNTAASTYIPPRHACRVGSRPHFTSQNNDVSFPHGEEVNLGHFPVSKSAETVQREQDTVLQAAQDFGTAGFSPRPGMSRGPLSQRGSPD